MSKCFRPHTIILPAARKPHPRRHNTNLIGSNESEFALLALPATFHIQNHIRRQKASFSGRGHREDADAYHRKGRVTVESPDAPHLIVYYPILSPQTGRPLCYCCRATNFFRNSSVGSRIQLPALSRTGLRAAEGCAILCEGSDISWRNYAKRSLLVSCCVCHSHCRHVLHCAGLGEANNKDWRA